VLAAFPALAPLAGVLPARRLALRLGYGYGPDGAPARLAPGNTWVELVPNGTGSVALG